MNNILEYIESADVFDLPDEGVGISADIPDLDYNDGFLNLLFIYFSEVKKLKILSVKEEEEFLIKAQNGDKESRDKIILNTLPLVIGIAKEYVKCSDHLKFGDLIQEGSTGVFRAIELYDKSRGPFYSYARIWIRQKITRALDRQSRMIVFPYAKVWAMLKVCKSYRTLMQVNCCCPTVEDVSKDTSMEKEEIDQILCDFQHVYSLDFKYTSSRYFEGDKTKQPLGELIRDSKEETPDVIVFNKCLKEDMLKELDTLDERTRKIINLRFGFEGEEHTLKEIGKKLGFSQVRAGQLLDRAFATFRRKKRFKELREYLY
jgi:RNA polymerase primary sigma factor